MDILEEAVAKNSFIVLHHICEGFMIMIQCATYSTLDTLQHQTLKFPQLCSSYGNTTYS